MSGSISSRRGFMTRRVRIRRGIEEFMTREVMIPKWADFLLGNGTQNLIPQNKLNHRHNEYVAGLDSCLSV
jgi:hypothetical protein